MKNGSRSEVSQLLSEEENQIKTDRRLGSAQISANFLEEINEYQKSSKKTKKKLREMKSDAEME
jgi:hypothetical protein